MIGSITLIVILLLLAGLLLWTVELDVRRAATKPAKVIETTGRLKTEGQPTTQPIMGAIR